MQRRRGPIEPKESKVFALCQFYLYFWYSALAGWSKCVALWAPALHLVPDLYQSSYSKQGEGLWVQHFSPSSELWCGPLGYDWSYTLGLAHAEHITPFKPQTTLSDMQYYPWITCEKNQDLVKQNRLLLHRPVSVMVFCSVDQQRQDILARRTIYF